MQFRFPHPMKRTRTWENRTTLNKAQLDHLLINGKWFNAIRNCRSYSSSKLGPDHQYYLTIKVSIGCTNNKGILNMIGTR
jgi:hypothetical protein